MFLKSFSKHKKRKKSDYSLFTKVILVREHNPIVRKKNLKYYDNSFAFQRLK